MSRHDVVRDVALADDQGSGADVTTARKSSLGHTGKIYAVPVGDVVRSSGPLVEAVYRSFEILIALLGLTLTLPLMVMQAIVIRCDSPGPVLFFHYRPGQSVKVRGRDLVGRSDLIPPSGGYEPDALYYVPSYFRLVKFRTMYSDARSRWPELYAYRFVPKEFHQQRVTLERDPRVTRVGGILRRLSIDELPNLLNVLVGDLRLVGPP